MRKLMAVVGLVAIAGWSARADEASDAAKKLEGKYEVISVTKGGNPEPKAEDVKAFIIKDGKITIEAKDRDMVARFKLDPSKKPAQIDLMPEGGGKDITLEGIYQTKDTEKGLELTIAFSRSARPKDFKGAGEDEMLVKLLRKK
jgi:uncharacterized protein (TIGR03067 family)